MNVWCRVGTVPESERERTSKTCTIDILYSVVRDKESFLPPHENGPPIAIRHGEMWSPEFVLDMPESRETLPMDHIFLFVRSPFFCQKAVAAADYLCVKVSCQLGPIIGQSTYAEVSAKERGREVDVL